MIVNTKDALEAENGAMRGIHAGMPPPLRHPPKGVKGDFKNDRC
jgi:hypothetical protein